MSGDAAVLWRARIDSWRGEEKERIAPTVVLLTRSLRGFEANAVQALVAAWPNLPRRWQPPESPPPENDGDAWWKMWGRLEDTVPDVMRATGLQERDATMALRVAVTNRIVYPDGTLTEGARAFLTAESATVLRRKMVQASK